MIEDDIDIGNLFSQWHIDIRNFTTGLGEYCSLKVLKKSKVITFDTFNYRKVLNLTNTNSCKEILSNILKVKNKEDFLNLLKDRDKVYPRGIERGYGVEKILQSVEDNKYHPIFFLELNKKHYIIDGRTRFYCCMFLNKPAKVRVMTDVDLNENCK